MRNILIVVLMSGGSEETCTWPASIRCRCRGLEPIVMVWAAIGYTTCTSLVLIDSSLNTEWYISENFRRVFVPYLRGVQNTIFQQNNVRPFFARCVLTLHETHVIELLPWLARFYICHPFKISVHTLLKDWPVISL